MMLMIIIADLLESGVDSEYEEMVTSAASNNPSKWTNNNKSSGGGNMTGSGACSQCVTVINVCPSPGHTLHTAQNQKSQPTNKMQTRHRQQKQQQHHQQQQQQTSGQQQQLITEPPYENLSFHKVTINVPDIADEVDGHHLYTEKPRVLLRKPPLRKSKVPLKYQARIETGIFGMERLTIEKF